MWSLFAASEKRGSMDLQGDDRIETNQDIAVDASKCGSGIGPRKVAYELGIMEVFDLNEKLF